MEKLMGIFKKMEIALNKNSCPDVLYIQCCLSFRLQVLSIFYTCSK